MDPDSISLAIFLMTLASIWYFRYRMRRTKRVFVTDYQRGLRYRAGSFSNELAPGAYRIYTPNEQLVVVDMRRNNLSSNAFSTATFSNPLPSSASEP